MAPVPTPEVLWRKPPVLALAALPGLHSAASAGRRPTADESEILTDDAVEFAGRARAVGVELLSMAR